MLDADDNDNHIRLLLSLGLTNNQQRLPLHVYGVSMNGGFHGAYSSIYECTSSSFVLQQYLSRASCVHCAHFSRGPDQAKDFEK